MSEHDLLAEVVAGEHAAVFAYGVLGARLDDRRRRLALAASDAHRARRDAVTALLRDRGAEVPVTAASYDVVVGGPAAALALAARVEDAMAVRWRDLVGGTDDVALRALGVSGLQEVATRAAGWRREAGVVPATTALPGTV